MAEKNNSEQKSNQNKQTLTLNSKYGGIYFVMSIAVIIFVVLLIILTIATKNVSLVYVVAGLGILYCAALFAFEIKRNKENKDMEKTETDIQEEANAKKKK